MLLRCVSDDDGDGERGAPTASTPSKGTPRDAHGLLPSRLVGAALLLLGFCLWRLRGLLLARCLDGRLRRLRHGLDLGRRLRVLLLGGLLAFGWDSRLPPWGLGLGRHVRSPKGDGARARGTRGRNFCRVCLRGGRGLGARAAFGRAAVPRRVGVDAGACGLGGSRRRCFLRSRFHLCARTFWGARARAKRRRAGYWGAWRTLGRTLRARAFGAP